MIDINKQYWLKYKDGTDTSSINDQQEAIIPKSLIKYYSVSDPYISYIIRQPKEVELDWGLGNTYPYSLIAEMAWYIAVQACAEQAKDRAQLGIRLISDWLEVYEIDKPICPGCRPEKLGTQLNIKEFLKDLVNMLLDAHCEEIVALANRIQNGDD